MSARRELTVFAGVLAALVASVSTVTTNRGVLMRRLALVALAVASLAVAAPAGAATIHVSIKKSGFSPSSVRINFGDTVTWTNTDTSNHQAGRCVSNESIPHPIVPKHMHPGHTRAAIPWTS